MKKGIVTCAGILAWLLLFSGIFYIVTRSPQEENPSSENASTSSAAPSGTGATEASTTATTAATTITTTTVPTVPVLPEIDTSGTPVYTAPVAGTWRTTVTYNPKGKSVSKETLDLLTAYFYHRANTFGRAAGMAVTEPAGLSISDTVRAEETSRIEALRNMMTLWDCRYAAAQTRFTVDKVLKENGEQILYVHEAAYFYNWYEGYTTPETADLSGYGNRHILHIRDGQIVADHYNEGEPTKMATPGRLTDDHYWTYIGNEDPPDDYIGQPVSVFAENKPTYSTTYDPQRAIAYADAWALSRNAEYTDYHAMGGDCANFVSQCLTAGGLQHDDTWYHKSYAWKSAPGLYNYLKSANGNGVGKGIAVIRCEDLTGRTAKLGDDTVDAATLFKPGSLVFYRWKSGFTQVKKWNHATMCIGYLGDGTPAISCHTDDKYHFKWTYGGTVCDYGSLLLTP